MSNIARLFVQPNPFDFDPAQVGEPEEDARHWKVVLVEEARAAAEARDQARDEREGDE